MILSDLQSVITQNNNGQNSLYLRNLLKEILQFYTLNFVYCSNWGNDFLFKGGTCMRICFDLPRLSEDLDFDIKNYSGFNLAKFLAEINNYFKAKWQLKSFSTRVAGNGNQIFLQFPVLKNLGLASRNDSDILFLRLDLAPVDSNIYTEEVSVKTAKNLTFIVKRYSLPDLFASKIAAILNRTFAKGKDNLITFKGRDYFDLIWFLEKGVTPNTKRLKDLLGAEKKDIFKNLDAKVALLKPEYLQEDLNPLFTDRQFITNFCQNYQQIYQNLKPAFKT